MFCDGCGTAVQSEQTFCSKCGKQFFVPGPTIQQRQPRVQSNVQLLGILWFVASGLNAAVGLFLCFLGSTVFGRLHQFGIPPNIPTGLLGSLVGSFGVLVLAKAACGFAAGWGLMRYEPWARVLALVLAFIALIHVPFGTAIGIYTLWVLLPGQSKQEYEMLSATRAA